MHIHMTHDNTPFMSRGPNAPMYSNKLPQRLKPQPVNDVVVAILDLSDPADLDSYSKICRAAGFRVASIISEDRQWIASTQNWKILLRWMIVGTMDPKDVRDTKHEVLLNALKKEKKE